MIELFILNTKEEIELISNNIQSQSFKALETFMMNFIQNTNLKESLSKVLEEIFEEIEKELIFCQSIFE